MEEHKLKKLYILNVLEDKVEEFRNKFDSINY